MEKRVKRARQKRKGEREREKERERERERERNALTAWCVSLGGLTFEQVVLHRSPFSSFCRKTFKIVENFFQFVSFFFNQKKSINVRFALFVTFKNNFLFLPRKYIISQLWYVFKFCHRPGGSFIYWVQEFFTLMKNKYN